MTTTTYLIRDVSLADDDSGALHEVSAETFLDAIRQVPGYEHVSRLEPVCEGSRKVRCYRWLEKCNAYTSVGTVRDVTK